MADQVEAKAEATKDVYELAYAVSARVQIINVVLAECKAARSGDLDLDSTTLKNTTLVSGLSHAQSAESKEIHVMVSFLLKGTQGSENEEKVPLSIMASFVLLYSISSFDGLADDHIKAFAQTNGLFNAWPYWREFVQSTTCRMGLTKPVVIPVFRLGQSIHVEQPSDNTP